MTATLHFDGIDADPLYQGATFRRRLYITKSELDLSQAESVVMKVRTNFGERLITEFSTQNNRIIIVSDEFENHVTLFADKDQSALMEPGEYLYDIFIYMGSGDAIKLMKGEINIIAAVSL